MSQTKLISLDNLTRYDGKIKELIGNVEAYQKQNDLNLEVTNRKNVANLSTFTNENNITFTADNSTGTVSASGSPLYSGWVAGACFTKKLPAGKYIVSCATNPNDLNVLIGMASQGVITTAGVEITVNAGDTVRLAWSLTASESISYTATGVMIRPAFITDSTFAPYIPSVENRLEDVESSSTSNTNDLTTGSRTKNILPVTLSGIKANNTTGTWSDNVYTINGGTITVSLDSDGNVVLINVNGTFTGNVLNFYLGEVTAVSDVILNGYTGTWDAGGMTLFAVEKGTASPEYSTGSGGQVLLESGKTYVVKLSFAKSTRNNTHLTPMVRLATISDYTFSPYIESVNSRLETLDSSISTLSGNISTLSGNLTKVANQVFDQNTRVYLKPNYRGNVSANVRTIKNIPSNHVGAIMTSSGIFVFKSNYAGNGFEVPQGSDLTITNTDNIYTFSCPGAWYTMCLFIFTWDPDWEATN